MVESVALIFYNSPVFLFNLKKFSKFEFEQPLLVKPDIPIELTARN